MSPQLIFACILVVLGILGLILTLVQVAIRMYTVCCNNDSMRHKSDVKNDMFQWIDYSLLSVLPSGNMGQGARETSV